jgi:hypothetical protein
MKTEGDVASSQLFKTYRAYLEDTGTRPSDAASDLANYAKTYRKLISWAEESKSIKHHVASQRLIKSVVEFEFNPLFSVLLWLFGPECKIEETVRERCAQILDSWVVRRAAAGLTAKNINKTALLLLHQLRQSGNQADLLKNFILGGAGIATIEDPSDSALIAFLQIAPAYRSLGQRRVAALLRAVEAGLNRGDPDWIPSGPLSVEHVMPSSWKDHWPVAVGDDAAIAKRRAAIHNLGNLILLTKRLNSSIGNSSWPAKRSAVAGMTVLLHVREVLASEDWNEETIVMRARQLATRIIERWPSVATL